MQPRLWAPYADSCLLQNSTQVPMRKLADGWWQAPIDLAPGDQYAFVVDGEPIPDPRSRAQPDGVHGRSLVVPIDAPRPFTPPPLADQIFYELHIGTFTEEGTFRAAVDRLDALVDLGVTTVEVMPIAEFPGTRGWGYDGVDLFAAHHAYGGASDFAAFVDAAHARNLTVFLDVVYNHLGPDGNYLPRLGPYFTDRYETPWGQAVNLDGPDSDEVRRFIVDNARMWLYEFAVDGLRLDATHALFDESPVPILDELQQETPGKLLVAEHEHHNPGLDGHWFDDVHHAIHAMLTGERDGYYRPFGSMESLVDALRRSDTSEITCIQNHDQIGNRARGDRLGHLVTDGQLRIAIALLLLGPGTPLLFMGEEWNASTPFQYFTDHVDPDLAEAVRQGRRREFAAFGWKPEDVPDPQSPDTFQRSKLNWEERDNGPQNATLAFYRDLIALRRSRPELRTGVCEVRQKSATALEMRRGDIQVKVDVAEEKLVIDS